MRPDPGGSPIGVGGQIGLYPSPIGVQNPGTSPIGQVEAPIREPPRSPGTEPAQADRRTSPIGEPAPSRHRPIGERTFSDRGGRSDRISPGRARIQNPIGEPTRSRSRPGPSPIGEAGREIGEPLGSALPFSDRKFPSILMSGRLIGEARRSDYTRGEDRFKFPDRRSSPIGSAGVPIGPRPIGTPALIGGAPGSTWNACAFRSGRGAARAPPPDRLAEDELADPPSRPTYRIGDERHSLLQRSEKQEESENRCDRMLRDEVFDSFHDHLPPHPRTDACLIARSAVIRASSTARCCCPIQERPHASQADRRSCRVRTPPRSGRIIRSRSRVSMIREGRRSTPIRENAAIKNGASNRRMLWPIQIAPSSISLIRGACSRNVGAADASAHPIPWNRVPRSRALPPRSKNGTRTMLPYLIRQQEHDLLGSQRAVSPIATIPTSTIASLLRSRPVVSRSRTHIR